MSIYTDFIASPNTQKQTIVEVDISEDSLFINYEPGIWFITYYVNEKNATYNFGNGAFGYGNFGSAGVADLTNNNARERIGSVWVDDKLYLKTTSLSDLRSNNESFFYDTSTFQLLMHFDDFNPPECFDFIQIGVTKGYAIQAAYYDDIYYDARVISIPNIVKSKDPLFFGLIRYPGGSIQFQNIDGHFDNWSTKNVFGQPIRILFGRFDFNYADFETVFAGTIDDFSLSPSINTVNVQDKRWALSRKIPINHFTSATYPNIKTHNVGKSIPLGYGVIGNAPVICTNEEGAAPFSFKIVDTTDYAIKAIDQVYVDDVSVTHGDEDLTNATFSLSAGVYSARDKVSVDFQGYETGGTLIDNGLDAIKDLMALFADVAFNSINYDTTEWNSAQTVVKDMCLFIEKEKSIIDIIGDICKSIPGSMVVQDDGLYTFKIRDPAKVPAGTIEVMELLEPLGVVYDSEEYLSSVLVQYNKDWKNNDYVTEIDTSQESAIFQLYKAYREKPFETLLVTEADAETFATTILDLAGTIEPIFTITTKTQNINLELEDVIDAELYIFSDGTYGTVRCEVIGIEKNLTNYTVTLTLRRISDITANIDQATLIKWQA